MSYCGRNEDGDGAEVRAERGDVDVGKINNGEGPKGQRVFGVGDRGDEVCSCREQLARIELVNERRELICGEDLGEICIPYISCSSMGSTSSSELDSVVEGSSNGSFR